MTAPETGEHTEERPETATVEHAGALPGTRASERTLPESGGYSGKRVGRRKRHG